MINTFLSHLEKLFYDSQPNFFGEIPLLKYHCDSLIIVRTLYVNLSKLVKIRGWFVEVSFYLGGEFEKSHVNFILKIDQVMP